MVVCFIPTSCAHLHRWRGRHNGEFVRSHACACGAASGQDERMTAESSNAPFLRCWGTFAWDSVPERGQGHTPYSLQSGHSQPQRSTQCDDTSSTAASSPAC